MIGVDEALRRVRAVHPGTRPVRRPVREAVGRVLAAPVRAGEPAPPFDRSAMDGYAVRVPDLDAASDHSPVRLPLAGPVPAGAPEAGHGGPRLEPETARRILTGAPLPDGATAVVRQEDVRVGDGWVEFRHPVEEGANVRRQGEEVRPGDPLLPAGEVVGPAAAALLLGQGIAEVDVLALPSLAVVATGDELVAPETEPGPGRIRDTVTPLLTGALGQLGISPTVALAPDDPPVLRRTLRRALDDHRIVLTSGGVSVGDRDHVRPALEELAVEERFWGVAQKPGKPLYFGSRGDRHVLGLPGNPVSAAVCFWIYGTVLVRRLAGYPGHLLPLPSCRTRLNEKDFRSHRRPRRTVFVRARARMAPDGTHRSEILARQGSHMLTGMAKADSLVRIPPGSENGPCLAYRLPVGPAVAGGRSDPESGGSRPVGGTGSR